MTKANKYFVACLLLTAATDLLAGQLPFRFIKLDADLLRSENSGLVETPTKLFHDMDPRVIAEGTGITDDVELLQQQGVGWGQGFVFARPMPDEKVLEFYRDMPRQ